MAANWANTAHLNSKRFLCGHCDNRVASVDGYYTSGAIPGAGWQGAIYICPECERPTYFCGGIVLPRPMPGGAVAGVPPEVLSLYNEARRSISAEAFTASVLASRKLLMNIAVGQGAEKGEAFVSYVDYLAKAGYVPPNGKAWVDHIRKKGNEATHEIPSMTEDDAVELVTFLEMLLKFIYEFPARVPSSTP